MTGLCLRVINISASYNDSDLQCILLPTLKHILQKQKFDNGRFNLKKLKGMEDKEQHQVKILKKIGDFENVIMR
jgi:hypothetical protein